MEACIADLTLPHDKVLVFVCGYFGGRIYDMAKCYSDNVVRVDAEWGECFSLDFMTAAIKEHNPQVVGIVHAETSTGVLQDLRGLGEVCREHDALLVVDTVTSLGGLPLLVDEWKIDAALRAARSACRARRACPPSPSGRAHTQS